MMIHPYLLYSKKQRPHLVKLSQSLYVGNFYLDGYHNINGLQNLGLGINELKTYINLKK